MGLHEQSHVGGLSDQSGPTPDRVVRSFWHGPFSACEALCLSSFVSAGVAVELFSETPVPGLPEGVTYRNAREILDQEVAFTGMSSTGPARLCIPTISVTRCSKNWRLADRYGRDAGRWATAGR